MSDVITTLRARLEALDDACETGDFAVSPELEALIRAHEPKDAAVLIGLTGDPKAPNVLLTKRAAQLRTHSGQIAFPGGRIDDSDEDAMAAALRECEEETAIDARHIEVLGQLPIYLTGSLFRIRPVVAYVSGRYQAIPNPNEVDEIFEVPFDFLMDADNHKIGSRVWQGQERHFYEMPYGEHYIWGVTAGIIRMMYERVWA